MSKGNGLSRSELEYEVRWMLRKAPADPAKVPEFMGNLIVSLIDKNNRALASSALDSERDDLPEPF